MANQRIQTKAVDILGRGESKGILAICALNKLVRAKEIYKKVELGKGRLSISFRWRSGKNLWGRFGGGWQWALGFRASGGALLLDCLIFDLMFSVNKGTGNIK